MTIPNAARLPLTLEEINAGWLTFALSQTYPGVEVTAAERTRVMQGASTKVWVGLEYNDRGKALALPPSVVVKGGLEHHSRKMAFMYESEARFYRDVAPRLEMNAPACHFVGVDREAGQSIVILEDLCLREVDFCRAERPLSYAQEARFLDAIARYHAQWWNRPELADDGEFGWMLTQLRTLAQSGYRSRLLQPELWEKETWDRFRALPRFGAIPRSLHDPVRLRAALDRLRERHELAPVVINHGDAHLGNLYIEADGTPGFFDAQVRRSTWAQDVAYHMTAALDIEDRRAWERSLLDYYLGRLRAHGVTDPPGFEEAWMAFRCELAYGLFVWLLNDNAFQTETTNTTNCARFGAACSDHEVLNLLLRG
jgi:hypothetical protein